MIGISSNDAGGAEILSEYVLKNKNNYLFFLSGPATKIFKKKFKNLKISNFKKSYNRLDKVISSTGWATKKEIRLIKFCKSRNIRVIAYLDHWVNYKDRFIINKKLYLPDEIWVGDSLALEIAKKTFKENVKIKKIKNNYFEKAKNYFSKKKNLNFTQKKQILYLSEPIDDHYKKKLFSEKDCINLFFNKINKIKNLDIKRIIFRPHPYENINKYKWVLNFKNFKIIIRRNKNLFNEISKSNLVAGCNTVALYLAVIANKKVYTSIPKGYVCEVPSKKIKYLNQVK